jgi:hypothetical protein
VDGYGDDNTPGEPPVSRFPRARSTKVMGRPRTAVRFTYPGADAPDHYGTASHAAISYDTIAEIALFGRADTYELEVGR